MHYLGHIGGTLRIIITSVTPRAQDKCMCIRNAEPKGEGNEMVRKVAEQTRGKQDRVKYQPEVI